MRPLPALPLLSAALFAAVTVPTAARADTIRVSDVAAADVTADGAFILLADGTVLDRTAGAVLGPAPGPVSDLASDSARVLYRVGDDWFVRDLADPAADPVVVNLDPDGHRVGIDRATLIENGQAVTFSTTETPARVLTIDVGAGHSTELLANATLGRASDDGQVFTFTRALAPELRPAGKASAGSKPSVPGTLYGYSVRGETPRVVGITSWREHLGAPNGAVPWP